MGACFKRDAKPQDGGDAALGGPAAEESRGLARLGEDEEERQSRFSVEPPAFLGSTPVLRVAASVL